MAIYLLRDARFIIYFYILCFLRIAVSISTLHVINKFLLSRLILTADEIEL